VAINVGGVRVTPITVGALHDHIAACIREGRREAVFNVNAHAVNLAQSDSELRAILNGATVAFCDGFGIQLAARLLGHAAPPRITYAAWLDLLASFCASQGFSMFLLGARPGVADEASRQIRRLTMVTTTIGARITSG
jgi:N-acetylglucosaminyldiphosphoundecaprenol N-acetyl-beta-D-mannosaminyltransferase